MTVIRNAEALVRTVATAVVITIAAAQAPLRADPRIHGNFVLVLDSSGSMRGATIDPSGERTKMSVARGFAGGLFERLATRSLNEGGLVVIGANYDADKRTNVVAGCRDVTVKMPLRHLDRSAADTARQAIDSSQARGYTPLGRAVASSIELLGRAGGSIVVVTDMEETCEDGTAEHACDVLRQANAARGPADRIFVDSIIVAKAANMKMDAVERLRACTRAPVVDITNDTDAAVAASIVADRLADLAATTDQPLTEPTRRLIVLDQRGDALIDPELTLILRHENTGQEIRRRLTTPTADVVVRSGPYRIETIRGDGAALAQGTVTVAPESTELVLSFARPKT